MLTLPLKEFLKTPCFPLEIILISPFLPLWNCTIDLNMSLYYNVSDWNEPDPQWLSKHRAVLEVSRVRTVLADGQNTRLVILTLQLIGVRHFKWNTDYKNSSQDSVTVTQDAIRWNSIFIFPAAVCHDMWWSVGKICLCSGSWNTGVMIQFHTSAQYILQVLSVLYSTPFCYFDTKRLYIRNQGGLDSNCNLRFSLRFTKRVSLIWSVPGDAATTTISLHLWLLHSFPF